MTDSISSSLHPQGNSHVVYNGSFYYHHRDHQEIIRYDLQTKKTIKVDVPEVATEGENYLYRLSRDYIDFNTDDNGLWAIYGLPENNNTVVMKLKPWTLEVRGPGKSQGVGEGWAMTGT